MAAQRRKAGSPPTYKYMVVGTGDFENPIFCSDIQRGVAEKVEEYDDAGYDQEHALSDIMVYEICAEFCVRHKTLYALQPAS